MEGTSVGNAKNTFSVGNLKGVIEDLNTHLGNVKKQFEDSYTNFVTTLRANWNGQDEEAFEKTIVKELNNIYENCFNLKESVVFYMTEAVRAYEKFQNSNCNLLNGNNEDEVEATATTAEYSKKTCGDSDYPEYNQQARNYDENAVMGLLSDDSGNNMMNAAETFKREVQNVINEFKNVQSNSNQIFYSSQVGENGDTDLGFSKLLDVVASSMGVFTKEIQKFMDDYIPTLVSNYAKQSQQIKENTIGTGDTSTNSVASSIKSKVTDTFGEDAYSEPKGS